MRVLWHRVLSLGHGVLLRCEASYTFFVPENCQRVARSDQHIQTQIEFESVEQIRVGNVLLHDVARRAYLLFILLALQLVSELLNIVDKEDAFALAGLTRLHDHHGGHSIFVLDFREITFQLGQLVWNNPGLWIEAEIDRILVLHFLQARGETCFLRNAAHRREMVHLLKGFELAELLCQNRNVVPDDIDVCVPVQLVTASLLSLRNLIVSVSLCYSFFLLLGLLVVVILVRFLLGRRDNFPLLLQGALAYQLVLRVGQVDPDFAAIEDIV